MKFKFAAALALCCLLCSCATENQTAQTSRLCLSPTRQTRNDDLRCYPLDCADCRFFTFGEELYLIMPERDGAVLQCCRGSAMRMQMLAHVGEDCVPCPGNLAACYDPATQMLHCFGAQETTCVLPGCLGTAYILAPFVYYCTAQGLMELNMDTGVYRTVRQEPGLTVTALLPGEDMAACLRSGGAGVVLRLSDGTAVQDAPAIRAAAQGKMGSNLCLTLGENDCLYLGKSEMVLPCGWRFLAFLPEKNAALVYRGDGLATYDLTTGNRTAFLSLSQNTPPDQTAATEAGIIYYSYGASLYRWEPETDIQRCKQVHITPVYTAQEPDTAGLAQCRQRGAYLQQQYGAKVLLNEGLEDILPDDCRVQPEHLQTYILSTLSSMEAVLGRFPSALVRQTFSKAGNVYLCPVRSITQNGEKRRGLLLCCEEDCHIIIAAGAQGEEAMLENFYPLVDRMVLDSGREDLGRLWKEETTAQRRQLLAMALKKESGETFLDVTMHNRLFDLTKALRETFSLTPDQALSWEQHLW